MYICPDKQTRLWIGGIDLSWNHWVWIGSAGEITWSNWAQTEPNDPDEICLEMNPYYNGEWNDQECNHRCMHVCEFVMN